MFDGIKSELLLNISELHGNGRPNQNHENNEKQFMRNSEFCFFRQLGARFLSLFPLFSTIGKKFTQLNNAGWAVANDFVRY